MRWGSTDLRLVLLLERLLEVLALGCDSELHLGWLHHRGRLEVLGGEEGGDELGRERGGLRLVRRLLLLERRELLERLLPRVASRHRTLLLDAVARRLALQGHLRPQVAGRLWLLVRSRFSSQLISLLPPELT